MRKVNFRPAQLLVEADRKWFARWLWRARNATSAVIKQAEAGEKISFNSAIWSDLKKFLLERDFLNKCAYCESRVTTTDFGDAEHYRPKAGITDHEGKAVQYGGVPHPGY
jgi:hypothetical protein